MLSCEQVTGKLSAQIDGELPLREWAALRFHQFLCSDCKAAATNMRSLVASLRNRLPVVIAAEEAPNDAYVERVMQALEGEGVTAAADRERTGKGAD